MKHKALLKLIEHVQHAVQSQGKRKARPRVVVRDGRHAVRRLELPLGLPSPRQRGSIATMSTYGLLGQEAERRRRALGLLCTLHVELFLVVVQHIPQHDRRKLRDTTP